MIFVVFWIMVAVLFLFLSFITFNKKLMIFSYSAVITGFFQLFEIEPLYTAVLFFTISLFIIILLRKEV
jgi:membrane protein implicated in regulation of membrane protease activity